jgi:hypothetical protein
MIICFPQLESKYFDFTCSVLSHFATYRSIPSKLRVLKQHH